MSQVKTSQASRRDLSGRSVLRTSGLVQAAVPWRVVIYQLCLWILLIALSIWAMMQGELKLSASEVVHAVFGQGKHLSVYFVTEVRAPRIVAAMLVGAALGLSGAIFQVISGNSLGSPDIIGFTNGAATGALISIILFNSGPFGVSWGAMIGGFVTSVLVWALTRHTGLRGFRLVLIGLGVGSTLAALNSLLVVRASLSQAQTAASWLAGSLNTMNWDKILFLLVPLLLLTPALLALVRPLGSLKFGDTVSAGLGVSVGKVRVGALFLGVILVSLATATTGPLAFVALAAPHIAKSLTKPVGAGLGSAALTGATLVLLSDLLGQYLLAAPLQVGVVTGAIGGVYLIYLIALERKK